MTLSDKKIILHIGGHKTGSTSLQCYLMDNREQLKAEGIYYPRIPDNKPTIEYGRNNEVNGFILQNKYYCPDALDNILDIYKNDNSIHTLILSEENLKSALFCLKNYPIGMIGPTEYLYKIADKVGPNKNTLKKLSNRINIECDLNKQFFVGGTMFFLTVEAMAPVMELSLLDNEFQSEPIPIDGTMAHAIERFFGVACSSQGLEVVDINFARDLSK